ncbi:alpha-L-fucosidase [Streptomyces sp. NBC_01716]|uniref:alpha-L-fucosidase n=1 Tax=Streptomyces sp. NBC_01716 TaxID=2975917 RepID=UPI002E2F83C4|nr:alpha-L-fucosidase [Streptomyces sp. NBC_01716]
MRKVIGVLLALLLAVGAEATSPPAAVATPADRPDGQTPRGIPGAIDLSADRDIAAWQRLQFGMFIHWGLFSELGGVWEGEPVTSGYSEQIQMWADISEEEYLDVAARFRPDRFDPAGICSLAKQAGMRYVVITSKHHDGFSMFDTATTDYDVTDATPYGKDPLKALADECRSQGLKFGFYFSLVDWHQGHEFDGGNNNPIPASMEPVIKAQIRELMTNYGDIAEVWFDMSSPTDAQSEEFAGIVRELQPKAAVNSRVWNNKGDFRTLGDNEIPSVALDGAWQTPASIYHDTWGYRSWQVRDDLPGKIRDLVVGLTGVRARGGNYLLNIGPRGDGSVVEFEADVLRGMGDWLDRHPDAVLDASATRFGGRPWGEVTVKDRDLFLHVTDWPESGELRLPGLATSVRKVGEDGAAGRLDWRLDGDDLVVTLPETPRDTVLPVIKVELGGELRVIPENTVSLGSADSGGNGAVVLGAQDFEDGYSYADEGSYGSTRRTTVRHTGYVTADRAGQVSLAVRGEARPDALYRVQVGERTRLVKGEELTREAIGPFSVRPGQVTPVTLTLARPAHAGEDLGLSLDAVLVAPTGSVVSWAQAPERLTVGTVTDVPVHVTNLGQDPARGTLALRSPTGWTTGGEAKFSGLKQGRTHTVTAPVSVPADSATGPATLETVVTGGGRRVLQLTGDVDVVLPNVAHGRTATQSSTAWDGVPSRAVDGDTAGDYLRDNTTTHTAEPSNQAWWQVDLERSHTIDTVEIWNRTDCCAERLADYWVLVSDTPFTAGSLEEARTAPGVTAVHLKDQAQRPTAVELGGAQGRYVRVQLASTTNPLSLTEVVVRAR